MLKGKLLSSFQIFYLYSLVSIIFTVSKPKDYNESLKPKTKRITLDSDTNRICILNVSFTGCEGQLTEK